MTLSNEAKDFLISEIKNSLKKSIMCRKYVMLGTENNINCFNYYCHDCSFKTDSFKSILSSLSFPSKEFSNKYNYIQDLCSGAAFGRDSIKFRNDTEKEHSIRKEIINLLFDTDKFGTYSSRKDAVKDFFDIIKESMEINNE